jgi:hypothetical protein
MMILLGAGLLASNMILKKEYDKVDKNDTYWTFAKVLEKHFKYLKISGGNITNVGFEQSSNCSVRVSNDWEHGSSENLFKTFVSNDTLYVQFTHLSQDEGEKNWMKRMMLVRIFSPELLYVEAFNSNFEMFKLKQKSIAVNVSGRSNFEVESFIPDLDSLNITQNDTSEVVFEMSPEFKGSEPAQSGFTKAQLNIKGVRAKINLPFEKTKNSQSMYIRSVTATVQGNSLLDIGHAQIGLIKLNITDSSGIILSGGALRKLHEQPF